MSDTEVETVNDEAQLPTPDADAADGGAAAPVDPEGTGDDAREAGDGSREAGGAHAHLVREGDIAADYLERLLDIVDYDGDIDLDVENGRAAVAIVGSDLHSLVGARGETLDALQELTRLAVQQQTGARSRLMLDVSGHRQARREELQKLATETAARVLETGEPARLSPMNPFERKVVHDAVATAEGVVSESEGEEPNRRVVILVEREPAGRRRGVGRRGVGRRGVGRRGVGR